MLLICSFIDILSVAESYVPLKKKKKMAGHDEEDRKLFVGGLPQECTQDDLKV